MRSPVKLHHHKHTGKLIHHRHTSYPVLFLLCLFTGIVVIFASHVARAGESAVTAMVLAPIPSGTPTFTSPVANTTTSNPIVRFEGTCPVITPQIIIGLYDNGALIGSTQCQSDGTFQVTAQIAPGERNIVARVITITNEFGQSSEPLTITYTPPITVTPPVTNPSTPPANTPGEQPSAPGSTNPTRRGGGSAPGSAPTVDNGELVIKSDNPFLSYGPNKAATWSGQFSGGTSPYTITIDWGDGEKTGDKGVGSEQKKYSHNYADNRMYSVSITITDASGQSLTRHFVAISLAGDTSGDNEPVAAVAVSQPFDPTTTALLLYALLSLFILLLWRYERLHYRQVIGVPIHYGWQATSSARAGKKQ